MKGYIHYIRSFYKIKVSFSDVKVDVNIPKKVKVDLVSKFTQILPILISTIIITIISIVSINISGNILSIQSIFFYSSFLIASIISMIILYFIDRKKNEKSYFEKINKWQKEYESQVKMANAAYLSKLEYLESIYIDRKSFLLTASQGKSSYLWNVVKKDEDYLTCQIGRSTIKSNIIYTLPADTDEIDSSIINRIENDKNEYAFFINAPFILSLNKIDPIGIYGSNRQNHLAYIITNFLARHDETLVRIVLLCRKDNFEKYQYCKWFPHIWSKNREVRFIDLNEKKDFVVQRISELYNEESVSNRPFVLFVVDTDQDENHLNKSDNEQETDVLSSKILEFAKSKVDSHEAQIIIVNNDLKSIPSYCKTIIEANNQISHVFNSDYPNGKELKIEKYDGFFLDTFARNLSKIQLVDVENNMSIPNKIGFLQLNNIEYLSEKMIDKFWAENKKIKCLLGAERNAIPKTRNNFKHAIIAGKAGSGKSQFISSFVLYLAMNYSPDLVNFLFIDFKGETLTNNFKTLPHMVGSFSNLASKRIGELNRIKVMLRNELEKRQYKINSALEEKKIKVADIENYNNEESLDSIPHLFIIIDEYVELLSSQSDIVEVLESISRLGRSSGLHLILSSQRLDNKISDQIKTNIDLSICFKVNDIEESRSMLGISGAENIRVAGRGFAKNENNFIEEFQAPWVEKSHKSSSLNIENKIFHVLNDGERLILGKVEELSNETELSFIVDLISSYAPKYKKDIFIDSLKDNLYWEDYISLSSMNKTVEANSKSILVGMVDDFFNQKQEPLELDISRHNHLIIGGSGKGKTIFLMSLIFAIILNYGTKDNQIYVVSIENNNFKAFEKFKNVFPIITEIEQFFRLIDFLEKEIQKRKQIFGLDFINFIEYNHANASKLDEVYVFVDNIDYILESFSDFISEKIDNILKVSISYGISFVFTSNVSADIRSLMRKIENKIYFYNSENVYFDKYDSINNVALPNIPGRCLVDYSGRILESQIFTFKQNEGETMHNTMGRYINEALKGKTQKTRDFILPKEILQIDYTNLVKLSKEENHVISNHNLVNIPLFLDNYSQTTVNLSQKSNSIFIFSSLISIIELIKYYTSYSFELNVETHVFDFDRDLDLLSYPMIKRYIYNDNLKSSLHNLKQSDEYKLIIVSKYSNLYSSLTGVEQDVLNEFDETLLDIYNSMFNNTMLIILDQNNKNPLKDSELMYDSRLYSYFRKNPKFVVSGESLEFNNNPPSILDLNYNKKVLPLNQAWYFNRNQVSRIILPKEL